MSTIQVLPDQIAALPDTFQRMFLNAPAELVSSEWVAQQAGFKSRFSVMNKISAGTAPPSFISGKRRMFDRKDAVLWIFSQCRPHFAKKAGA